MLARLQQPRHLHGQGRTARYDMAAGGKLDSRPRQRHRIDAMVRTKAFVLIGKQHLQKARVDILHRLRQPPAPFAGGIGAQQLALAVEYHMRGFEILAERRRSQRIDPRAADECGHRRRSGKACEDETGALHFAAEISIAPVAVRPKRSGWYMSSTIACGST